LACGATGLTITSLPEEKATAFESGDHDSECTIESVCASVERSSPDRDQILITPSSPPVAIAVPSLFHRTQITAPCAQSLGQD
jgi:hypothetical protein